MGLRSWVGFAVIIAICVLLLLGDVLVFRPRREQLRELTRELAVAEMERAYVAGHSSSLERITDFLPEPLEGANEGEQKFLSSVSRKLQDSGMVLTRVEPRRVTQDGSYTRRSFKLEVEGGYRQFANFLQYLEMMPEVVLVNSFEVHSGSLRNSRRHSATLTVTVIGY